MTKAEEIVEHIREDRRDVVRVYWSGVVPQGPQEDTWAFGLTNKPEVNNPRGNQAKRDYKFPMRNADEAREVFNGICDILNQPELAAAFSTTNVDLAKPLFLKVSVN